MLEPSFLPPARCPVTAKWKAPARIFGGGRVMTLAQCACQHARASSLFRSRRPSIPFQIHCTVKCPLRRVRWPGLAPAVPLPPLSQRDPHCPSPRLLVVGVAHHLVMDGLGLEVLRRLVVARPGPTSGQFHIWLCLVSRPEMCPCAILILSHHITFMWQFFLASLHFFQSSLPSRI